MSKTEVLTIKDCIIQCTSRYHHSIPDNEIIYYFDIYSKTLFRYKQYSGCSTPDKLRYDHIGTSGQKLGVGLDTLIKYMISHKNCYIFYYNQKCAVFSQSKCSKWLELIDKFKKCSDFEIEEYKLKHNTLNKICLEASYIYSSELQLVDTASNVTTYKSGQKLDSSKVIDTVIDTVTNSLLYVDINLSIYMSRRSDLRGYILDYIKSHYVSILEVDGKIKPEASGEDNPHISETKKELDITETKRPIGLSDSQIQEYCTTY